MCKYAYTCRLCKHTINVNAIYENMQDVKIEIASDCPNLGMFANNPIKLDAMRELMVPRHQSDFARLLEDHHHLSECSVYDSVIEAIGREMGRYYEIA